MVATADPWAGLDAASQTRAGGLAALNELKEAGEAPLWSSMRLSPRRVSLRELCQATKLDEKVLDPTAEEFSLEDIQGAFLKVLLGCTVAATAVAALGDLLGLDAGFRFTATYLVAGIPIAVLAIGSVAPGILFLPIEIFRGMTANAEEKRRRDERVCRHEASHLLCAYVLGLPVQDVVADAKGPRVVVHDEAMVQQPGRFVDAGAVNELAVVAMSGFMAEADAYGKALGAAEDFAVLNSMLVRCSPPMSAQEQQDTTRYGALMAWTIGKKHANALDAVTEALAAGKGLAECLRAAESAERGQAEADAAAAAAAAEKLANETPQERAARERQEMAARGKL